MGRHMKRWLPPISVSVLLHGAAAGGMVCAFWLLARPREEVREEKPVVIAQEEMVVSAAPPGNADAAEMLRKEPSVPAALPTPKLPAKSNEGGWEMQQAAVP